MVCICIIGILDFASFYLSWTYLSAFIQILKGWDQTRTGYFASTQNVTSTVIGIIVGYLMAATGRYKFLLVGGIIVRLIGVSMMIRFRSNHAPTPMLVLCQLLQGIGGGSVAITMQVAVQCMVRHSDVAIVTAIELLMTECGAAMGSAIAGMIFSTDLPAALASRLPNIPQDDINSIYGSLSIALSYPIGSPIREAIIEAWVQVMHKLCIVASLALVPAVFLALAIPDGTLPDILHHRLDPSHHHYHNHHNHNLNYPHHRQNRSGRPHARSSLGSVNRPSISSKRPVSRQRPMTIAGETDIPSRQAVLRTSSEPITEDNTTPAPA